ncbi:alpha/beta hydrolase [Sphingopyxis terrae]|uniref:AB hydrolase-1 domain-containing protein n=1 Tax=Sphingopyxis terrae subsp. ummariensis TaxID=429001 RepID=A0A1Y6FNB2_9SPHN|nr:alpha/beta hydrolase [Sphingopyxis terrae]PCF90931.1 alpha/beta hydrolase [Sphingopyxis terrae subsp. ummariensis]SMQ76458.1 hypothetical protein SAMN06295984_1897 [Sphingopyxis terrae subsp. ummariensis]
MKQDVSFLSAGLNLAACLYTPKRPNGRTIIVGHPGSSVKEQSPALYAGKLCERGFRVLTFDAAHQGASEGLPRGLENPAKRVEDFKAAVSWLQTCPEVDPARIGGLGICASGGYIIQAAAGDTRISAVATVAAVDVGRQVRVGANGAQDPALLQALLDGAAQARSEAAVTGKIEGFPIFPADEASARAGDLHLFEGWEYYCTPRGAHPRAAKALTWDSIDRMATFDAFRFIAMIAPRPLLMITADKAVTAWMTHDAYERAQQPKSLHIIEGATHVGLYDREDAVNDAVGRLSDFYTDVL